MERDGYNTIMITCTRVLEADIAHRVMNHESKCRTLHGHRFKFEITAVADKLDSVGRIIDFGVLKSTVGAWIDEQWDHNTILFKEDEYLINALIKTPNQMKFPFVASWNPTAENIADFLLRDVCPKVLRNTGVKVISVRVWETPNGIAEAKLDA